MTWDSVPMLCFLLCFMVQVQSPLSLGRTGLTNKLPLGIGVNRPLSNVLLPCLFHSNCGNGVPTPLHFNSPDIPFLRVCCGRTFVNCAFKEIHNIQVQPGLTAKVPLINLQFKSNNKLVIHKSVNFRARVKEILHGVNSLICTPKK